MYNQKQNTSEKVKPYIYKHEFLIINLKRKKNYMNLKIQCKYWNKSFSKFCIFSSWISMYMLNNVIIKDKKVIKNISWFFMI